MKMVLNKKGITPIVATILLLLLVVAVGGFTYVWMTKMTKGITGGIWERFMGLITKMKASATIETIRPGGNENLSLHVRNTGKGDISIDATRDAAYCNNKPMDLLNNVTISPGEIKEVVVDCNVTIDGGTCCCNLSVHRVDIKVTTPNVNILGSLFNRSTRGSPACVWVS